MLTNNALLIDVLMLTTTTALCHADVLTAVLLVRGQPGPIRADWLSRASAGVVSANIPTIQGSAERGPHLRRARHCCQLSTCCPTSTEEGGGKTTISRRRVVTTQASCSFVQARPQFSSAFFFDFQAGPLLLCLTPLCACVIEL